MPPRIDAPPIHTNGHIATASGVLLPPNASYSGPLAAPPDGATHIQSLVERYGWLQESIDGFQPGVPLQKEMQTGFVKLAEKGSGYDDLINQFLVDGRIANAGISPVLSGQIIAVLNRQQAQARNSEITLSGRTFPVKNARNAISRYNDSPLGYTGAISQIIYQMRTYNRGAPHSTIPLTMPFEAWDGVGMNAVPLPGKTETESSTSHFYMEVDWERHGTPVPYLPSVFDLEATGQQEWPYWYRFHPDGLDKPAKWILLHWSQIIGVIPGHSGQAGIGTSSAYLCWDFLCDLVLEKQRRAEQTIHRPTDGILMLSGVDQTPQVVKEQLEGEKTERISQGRKVDKGFTIFTNEEPMKAELLRFATAVAEYVEVNQHIEDKIAQFMEEPLIAVVSRGNVGFGVQSDVAVETTADSGVHSILTLVSMVLGQIYSRVQISITRPNDMAKQRQIENLGKFAASIPALSTILSVDELRLIMNANVMQIPATTEGNVSQNATVDENDDSEDVNENPDEGDDDRPSTGSASSPTSSGSDTEDAELSRQLHRLSLEARSIWKLQTIDDALTSDEHFRFMQLVAAGLTGQYEASNIAAIVTEARSQGIDPNAVGATELIAEIVARHTPGASESTDTEELAAILLLLAIMGRQDAEQDAFDFDERELDNEQRNNVDAQGEQYGLDRVVSLYFGNPDDANVEVDEDGRSPIDSPWLEQTLDTESYNELAGFVRRGMREAESDSLIPAFVTALIAGAVAVRSLRIAENEDARGYFGGFSRGGRALGAQRKRWLMTTARRPRAVHLAQVGQVVGYEDRFRDGSRWSGELAGCQCGIELLW